MKTQTQEVSLLNAAVIVAAFLGGVTAFQTRYQLFPGVQMSVVGLIVNNQTADGAEPELLDEGEFIVTTVRGVFVGKSVTHDFQWSKLVSHKTEPLMNNVVVYLPVSNRQKIYGIAADSAGIANMQRRLAFGVAVALGRNEQYVDGLKAEREKLLKEKQQLGVIH